MPETPPPQPPRTLIVHGGTAIPVIDNGDHRTAGLMSHVGSPDLDEVVALMTPGEALHIACELIAYAIR